VQIKERILQIYVSDPLKAMRDGAQGQGSVQTETQGVPFHFPAGTIETKKQRESSSQARRSAADGVFGEYGLVQAPARAV